MKCKLLLLFLSFSYFAQAQFDFEPNSDSSSIHFTEDADFIFQYKFLIGGQLFSSYLEISRKVDSSWAYRRIVNIHLDGHSIELPPLESNINFERLWEDLATFDFLRLKPENELSYKHLSKNFIADFTYEKYQMLQGLHSPIYISEFKSEKGIRSIYHNEPFRVIQGINNSGQNWYLPEFYKVTFCYKLLMSKFQFDDYNEAAFEYIRSSFASDRKKRNKRW